MSVIQPGGIDTRFAEHERLSFCHGRADGPYAEFTAKVVDRLSHNPAVLHPDQVAQAIHRAAAAKRPRPHYRVGSVAHIMLALHHALPATLWDRLIPKITPTPAGH